MDPAKVSKASTAAYGLAQWLRAMVAYDRVAKIVAPKRAALAEAEAAYNEVMEGLRGKQVRAGPIIVYPLFPLYTPAQPYLHLCTPVTHVYTPYSHLYILLTHLNTPYTP